jgi:CubicO group peptidase (beta-lactamase class C family)
LGSGLLAVIVERLTGQSFAQAAAELVLQPLRIEGYLGSEPPRRPAYLSIDYGEHAGTELEPNNSPFWRALALPWGGLSI